MLRAIPHHKRAAYNYEVESAFHATLRMAKLLLGTVESETLRCYYERTGEDTGAETLLHEIISPILYLRLTNEADNLYAIRFGIGPVGDQGYLNFVTIEFLRTLMEYTDERSLITPIDPGFSIKDCVLADWFINCCSEMFDYIDCMNKNHVLRSVPYVALQE